MSEEDKLYLKNAIEISVKKNMAPINRKFRIMMITAISTMLTMLSIFLAMAGPVSATAYSAKTKADKNSETINSKVDNSFLLQHYVSKNLYGYMDNKEHKIDILAFKNPSNAEVLYYSFEQDMHNLLGLEQFRASNDNK